MDDNRVAETQSADGNQVPSKVIPDGALDYIRLEYALWAVNGVISLINLLEKEDRTGSR